MIITNKKIAGLEPRWAEFRGFSLLFDNPGFSLKAFSVLAYLDCNVEQDNELRLYNLLRMSMEQLEHGDLSDSFSLCLLPPASYHVTAWDGVNDDNIDLVFSPHRKVFKQFLQGLPDSILKMDLFPQVTGSALVTKSDWNIQFKFERLENWSNVSLVARLAPADDASVLALQHLTATRAELSAEFEQWHGVRPHETFAPHVTLGYFADPDMAKSTDPFLDQWNESLLEKTQGEVLSVHRVSPYGFTDMATFFKAVES